MLDDRFGGKVYDSPRPLINTDDGTLYAPSTPEHKAHQIRQQQTGNYSYVYTPKVYSNTPIIKPTSYAQAQAQRDRAREQALAEQRRQQNIRNEYSRATGSKGKAKLREAQNLFKNWGKALEETLKHVCNPQTAKGKDSGSRNKPNISVSDFRKIEEANKYGLTVAEKAKIDDMNLAQLTNTYSFLNNVTPYQGYSVSNAKERDYIIARYRKLMSESQPKPPSIKDNPLYNYYNQIILTGVDPHTGRKVSNLELTQAIAGQSALIAGPFVDAASLGYGYSYREQVGNNGISSIKTSTTGTGKVYGPQPADGPLQPLKPYGPEQYSGLLQPLQDTISETVRVGRWMSPEEYNKMIETGKVQMSPNGNRTFVSNPADIEAFQSSAKGSVYIEFDVDKNYIFQAGQENWGQIPGPGSKFDKLLEKRGVPILDGMPDAYNIKKVGEK